MFYETWLHFVGGNFKSHGKKAFVEHYDNVRGLVLKDRLLEYHIKDGWEPLCEFLGVECPQKPFPSGNDTGDFKTLVRQLDWMRVREVMLQHAIILAAVGVAVPGMVLAGWYSGMSFLQ